MSVPGEGYSKTASCALSTFVLHRHTLIVLDLVLILINLLFYDLYKMMDYLWFYGFNAIFTNISVIFYEPRKCEDDRPRKL